MSINAIWWDDLECASSVANVPKRLRKKFAGKKINFRLYHRCKGFFHYRCHMVKTDGQVDAVDNMEDWTTGRFTYDNEKCYYFETEEDAVIFKLKYGIQGNT